MKYFIIILLLTACPKDKPIDDSQIKSDSIIQPCKENCAQAMPADIIGAKK